jgi:hypothetical protein
LLPSSATGWKRLEFVDKQLCGIWFKQRARRCGLEVRRSTTTRVVARSSPLNPGIFLILLLISSVPIVKVCLYPTLYLHRISTRAKNKDVLLNKKKRFKQSFMVHQFHGP